jgi:hypothetical protein
MAVSRHQNVGQNHKLPIYNKFFENVAKIDEEIKEQIKFGECLVPFCSEFLVFPCPLKS